MGYIIYMGAFYGSTTVQYCTVRVHTGTVQYCNINTLIMYLGQYPGWPDSERTGGAPIMLLRSSPSSAHYRRGNSLLTTPTSHAHPPPPTAAAAVASPQLPKPRRHNAYLLHRQGKKKNNPKNCKKEKWGLKLRSAASDGSASDVIEVMEDARYHGEDAGVIDMPDRWGFTPTIGAAMFGRAAVLEVLLARGAKLELTTDAGETALHWGSLNGHTAVCALLLSAGADPNAQQVKGKTPLMLASEQGCHEIVQLQIDAGAECGLRDGSNRTALEYAIAHGHERCIDILRHASTRRVQLQYLDKRRECEDIRLKADALRDTVQRLEAESDCLKEIVAKEEWRIVELEAEVDAARQREGTSGLEDEEEEEEVEESYSQRHRRGRRNQSSLARMMIESESAKKKLKKKIIRKKMKNRRRSPSSRGIFTISPKEHATLDGTPNTMVMKQKGKEDKPKWRVVV